MKKILIFALLAWFSWPLSAHSTVFDNTPLNTNKYGYLFEIHGSNTIGAELAPNLLTTWLSIHHFTGIEIAETSTKNERIITATSPKNDNIKIFVAAHGSGTGFEQIVAGRADIAAASRPIKNAENDLFPESDLTQFTNETVLAIDGLAIIIHPNINIDHLTVKQVGQLFSGEVSNWNQIGGPNLAVKVHARDNQSGTFDTFNALVLTRGFSLVDSAVRYESNAKLSERVATEPGSIGFTALATINSAKAIAIIDGSSQPMQPIATTIATEDYPLSRRLYLYHNNTSNKFAADFLAFVKSQQGQNIVADTGFVSQNLSSLNLKLSGDLPTGYKFMTERSQRVTTNFRFIPGEKGLDNKALDDLIRIRDFMALPENINRSIILVGFVDKQTSEFRARLLSEARVNKVKQQLSTVGITANAMTGYGEINPVADNTDEKFALRNQRVEVWIR
jgi:phosphate transport system substrate-binding protein